MRRTLALSLVALTALAIFMIPAAADHDDRFGARLSGSNEAPAISTAASGRFSGKLSSNGTALEYTLSYKDLSSDPTQAHLHFAQKDVNGGISVWLCSNLDPPGQTPPGTQPCPDSPATIDGTIQAANVVGPAGQGITTGEFAELVRALQSGLVYANVHTGTFGGGEIRGQAKGS